jgi:hypothetical protein
LPIAAAGRRRPKPRGVKSENDPRSRSAFVSTAQPERSRRWRNLIPKLWRQDPQARHLAFEPELRSERPRDATDSLWPSALPGLELRELTSLLDTLKLIVGRRWPLIALLFALELAIIVLVSTSAFLPSEMTAYERQYNTTSAVLNQTATAQTAAIFTNNLRVAMFELLPLVGLAIFGLSLYETARIVEVIGIIHGQNVGLALGTRSPQPRASTWSTR